MTSSPEEALRFGLRLANAENLSEDEVIEAIVAVEKERDFPTFFDTLDPEQFNSETKVLPGYAKERLLSAVEQYVKRRT